VPGDSRRRIPVANEEDEVDTLARIINSSSGDPGDFTPLFLEVVRRVFEERAVPLTAQLKAQIERAFDSWLEEDSGPGMAGAVPVGEAPRTAARLGLLRRLCDFLRGPAAACFLSVNMSTAPRLRAANESPPDARRRTASGRYDTATESCASSEESLDDIAASPQEYEFRNAAEVREYVREWPGLVGVLEELPGQARQRFGADTSLALEVCPDREGEGPPLLYAHVITLLSADEAWDRLLSLEQEWWLDATESMPVNLHVEFA
jgi:hypothetical protein